MLILSCQLPSPGSCLLHFQPSDSAWEDAEEAPRQEGPLSSDIKADRKEYYLRRSNLVQSLFCFNKSLDLWAVNGTEVEIGLQCDSVGRVLKQA